MHLEQIGSCDMDWISLAQDSVQWRVLVNTVIKFWVAQEIIICWDICDHVFCVSVQIARAMNSAAWLQ
jgi:hypothetical protein